MATDVTCSVVCMSVGCSTAPNLDHVQGSNGTTPFCCPVTLPNGSQPPVKNFGGTVTYSPTYRGPLTDRAEGSHGNGKLWAVLPLDGKLLATPEKEGSLRWKFPWWRAVRGPLTVRGRRLDGPAGPLRAHIPAGYGETGFQASGIFFPSEGCWEITGRAGDAELTFVLEVRVKK
jgi:hypothetical protein